jgi:hypothetical protein
VRTGVIWPGVGPRRWDGDFRKAGARKSDSGKVVDERKWKAVDLETKISVTNNDNGQYFQKC